MKRYLIAVVALAGCVDSPSPPSDEPNVSTLDQDIQSCMSSCDGPTYNGIPVSCTSNIVCVSQSNGVGCLNDDQTSVTIVYCGIRVCGDGICTQPGEDTLNCPEDCACPTGTADCCGDGYCYSLNYCRKGYCDY